MKQKQGIFRTGCRQVHITYRHKCRKKLHIFLGGLYLVYPTQLNTIFCLFQILEEYKDSFPIQIKDVKSADDPMTAVAEGLLIKAMSKYKKE